MRNNIMKVILSFCMVMGISSLTNATIYADAAESEYIVYHNGETVVKTEDDDSLTKEILQDNNITIQSLTKKKKERLEKKGFTVEKDQVIKANAADSGETNIDGTEMIEQWSLEAINAVDSDTASQIKIAIIDSGVSATEDISVAERKCFVDGEEDISPLWEDATGHGTAIAGMIAAKDNNIGITGVLPGYPIYSLRVLDENNSASISQVVAAIYWAIDNDVDILNMSFGTAYDSKILKQAVDDAYDAGIVMVAAAGNDSTEAVQYPAAYPEVIAVGGSNSHGELSDVSSAGTELEMVAPGENVVSTGLLDGMAGVSGTSIATAQVTAALAQLWNQDITKDGDFVRQLLNATSRKLQGSDGYGYGLIDIQAAMKGYKTFEVEYHKSDMIHHVNTESAEDFGDVKSVSALWTPDGHENIIRGYINPRVDISKANLDIMVHTARGADNASYKSPSSALHGTGNYVKGLKFLYLVAQKVRSGVASEKACNDVYGEITVNPAKEEITISSLNTVTKRMLANGGSGNGERFYRVMGFALHCIGDTFAHRAYVYELKGFEKADFYDYTGFISEYKKGTLEYRDIKDYTDKSLSTYEDNTSIGPNRYKNAKLKSLDFYKAAKDKKGYTSRFFKNLTYTLTLDSFATFDSNY